MPRFVGILLLSFLMLGPVCAQAQYTFVGADGCAVLPTGDLKDQTTSGGGGTIHLDQILSAHFQARLDAGWMQFSSRDLDGGDQSQARVIPVRLGLHWMVGPFDGTRFYLGAMAGAYFRQISLERNAIVGGEDFNNEDTFFGAAACLGMLIPVSADGGQIEIKASYDLWFDEKDLAEETLDMGFIRLGVGYRFNI